MQLLRRSILILAIFGMGFGTSAVAQQYVVFNGGISLAEREAAPTTGTKLSFFVRAGNYLSNVRVVITNEAGNELVNIVTDGPWLILDLPNGTYNVSASLNGETQSLAVNVDGSNQEVGFMFTSVD